MQPFIRSGKHAAALAATLVLVVDSGVLAAVPEAGRPPAALQRPALAVARPAAANLQAIARTGNRLVAAGERGLIIYSDDSGRHWTQARVPVSVTVTALRFAATAGGNAREGWAVGNMGVVLRTTDGGASWIRVFDGAAAAGLAVQAARQAWDSVKPDPSETEHPLNRLLDDARRLADEGADKPFLDIAQRADGSVWVVGAYGLAFSTADGGRTWHARMKDLPNPEGVTWYGIASRGQERYLFGEQGALLRAAAQDGAFAAQASPAAGSLFGSLALDDGSLLLFGLRGKVYRSGQPGAPWSTVQTPVDASLVSGVQLPDGTALLLGSAGQIVASRDGGRSFNVLPLQPRFPFAGAAVAPDGTLVIVGARGLLRMAPPGRAAGISTMRAARP
ncbi:photosystem II stability/assembly factor-like protein [Massilia dura]|uniref:Photosystem II stability/assembly factor-like protein n=2 Tax=Pseudoduganella dura TaxID=321982 RepID=A0A6I3XIW1_9BURK|nr:photosystem II stability/assembly factor-like protein [Pseudoduganella dura]